MVFNLLFFFLTLLLLWDDRLRNGITLPPVGLYVGWYVIMQVSVGLCGKGRMRSTNLAMGPRIQELQLWILKDLVPKTCRRIKTEKQF